MAQPDQQKKDWDSPMHKSQTQLVTVLIVALVGAILGNFMIDNNFAQTGLYFVAIPGILAIMVTVLPFGKGQTTFGVARGTSIAVLASAILLREGFICVLMALPLIIPVVALVSWSRRPKNGDTDKRLLSAVGPLLLVALAGDGTAYELPTRVEVTETRIIDASAEDFSESLALPATIPDIAPLLFALPFPKPTAFEGDGLDQGDKRTIVFGEMGEIELTITAVSDSAVTWTFTDDTTPLSDWMTFHSATARWVETDAGLAITMEIVFDRELAPGVYFDPLERWGVGEMAEVLLDMLEHNAQTHA